MNDPYDPNDPIDRLALAGYRLVQESPSLKDKIVDLLEALSFPERFELQDGKIVRKDRINE